MEKKSNSLVKLIAVLALLGVLVSIYSMMHKQGFTSGALCNINETFNCDIVNQGPYSDIFGIPVALLGIIGYALMFFAAIGKLKQPEDKGMSSFLVLASVGGFFFALYLSGIEAFVLHAWCLVCLTSQTIITVIAALAIYNYRKEKRV